MLYFSYIFYIRVIIMSKEKSITLAYDKTISNEKFFISTDKIGTKFTGGNLLLKNEYKKYVIAALIAVDIISIFSTTT